MANGQFDEEYDAANQVVPPSQIIPGGGTATIGTQTIPFNRQVWDASDWSRYIQRADAYDAIKRQVQQNEESAKMKAAEDREFMSLMSQNAGVKQSQQAVSAAMKFQAMRGYERDFQAAKASGLSDSQAGLQAFFRNPTVVSGQSVMAAQPAFEPKATTIGGAPAVRSGRYGERVQFVPQNNGIQMTVSPPDSVGGIPMGPPRTTYRGPVDKMQEFQRTNSPAIKSKAERDSLPLGTQYIGPDGKIYTRK
jgi:hypothetical protein